MNLFLLSIIFCAGFTQMNFCMDQEQQQLMRTLMPDIPRRITELKRETSENIIRMHQNEATNPHTDLDNMTNKLIGQMPRLNPESTTNQCTDMPTKAAESEIAYRLVALVSQQQPQRTVKTP